MQHKRPGWTAKQERRQVVVDHFQSSELTLKKREQEELKTLRKKLAEGPKSGWRAPRRRKRKLDD